MITIGVKWIDIPNAHNVYCGKGSVFGNPFASKGMSEDERNAACDNYFKYFYKEALRDNSPLRKGCMELLELHLQGVNINLQCFCAGKRCHCETIKDAIEASV